MKEYIVILDTDTEEILAHELTEEDKGEMTTEEYMLYTDEGMEKFFSKFNLEIDKCLWMFTNIQPKLKFV